MAGQSQRMAEVVERVPVVHAPGVFEHRDRLLLEGDGLVVLALVAQVEGLSVETTALGGAAAGARRGSAALSCLRLRLRRSGGGGVARRACLGVFSFCGGPPFLL